MDIALKPQLPPVLTLDGDSNASSTTEADTSALLDGADHRSHHLLKHCLSTGQRDGALAHFTTDDVKEAAREVSRMGQRELQARFKAVYGTTTHSNNNDWLRRKLFEAIGAAPMKAAVKSKPRKAASKARRGTSVPSSPVTKGLIGRAAGSRSCFGTPRPLALDGAATLALGSPELSLEDGSEEGSYSFVPGISLGKGDSGSATPQSVLGAAPGSAGARLERSAWSGTAPAPPAQLADDFRAGLFTAEALGPAPEWGSGTLDLDALRSDCALCAEADDDVMMLQLDLSAFD